MGIELTLAHGVTKYSAMGFVSYAFALCQISPMKEISKACSIGKLALQLLDQFESTDIVARVNFVYYSFVAHYTDPLQSCCSKLKEVFKIGIAKADTFSAFGSAVPYVQLSILGGVNLQNILRETDYYLSLMKQHKKLGQLPKRYFLICRETIGTIDKGESIKKDDDESE